MRPRRERLQLFRDVLNTIKSGVAVRTRITKKANISWERLCSVLEVLEQKGYVDPTVTRKGRIRVHITPSGQEIFHILDKACVALDLK